MKGFSAKTQFKMKAIIFTHQNLFLNYFFFLLLCLITDIINCQIHLALIIRFNVYCTYNKLKQVWGLLRDRPSTAMSPNKDPQRLLGSMSHKSVTMSCVASCIQETGC